MKTENGTRESPGAGASPPAAGPRAIYALGAKEFDWIYGPDQRRAISQLIAIPDRAYTQEMLQTNPEVLAPVEILFSGWGGPRVDAQFLELAPRLKLVFGAGALSSAATFVAWERGVRFCSAAAANSVPVAEYAQAMIVLGLKHVWRHAADMKQQKRRAENDFAPGCYRRTVGLVSMGAVGRILAGKLATSELRVIAYDPFLPPAQAAALGVEMVSLPHLFASSQAVSLHTPLLPETRGMITGELIALMPTGATFINTSRGAIVREDHLIAVARRRPDLQFILDVTDPEPPAPGSPLYALPNVVLTPHLAGSLGQECHRMGQMVADDFRRYLAGEPMLHEITAAMAQHGIHRPMAP